MGDVVADSSPRLQRFRNDFAMRFRSHGLRRTSSPRAWRRPTRAPRRPRPGPPARRGCPASTIWPSSITRMRSAWRAVGSRWATTTVVRPAATACMARCTWASLARSSWEVASSSSRMAGSTRRARARAMSWRWPDDSDRPRSLTGVQVAARQRGHEVVGADRPGRGLDLGVGGVGSSVGDVVAHRAGEEEGLLGHDAELAAERAEVELAQVGAVDQHPSGRRVVEAGDELDDGRLPGAGLADQRDGLARGDGERRPRRAPRRPRCSGSGSARRRSAPRPAPDPDRTGRPPPACRSGW